MITDTEKTVFADLADLEKSFKDDSGGDRARAMIKYFGEAAEQTAAMPQTPELDHRMVEQLTQGFQAAQRIVRQVWESIHNCTLAI